MHLSYAQLAKRPAILHRLVGLSVAEFEHLLEEFSVQYHQQVIQPRVSAPDRMRALGAGQKGALPTVADKLLFILVYTRMYPLLIVHGMFFGLVESKACTWVGILLPVLDAALGQIHVRPRRAKGRSLEELIEEFPELKERRSAHRRNGAARPPPERCHAAERGLFWEEKAPYEEACHSDASQDAVHSRRE